MAIKGRSSQARAGVSDSAGLSRVIGLRCRPALGQIGEGGLAVAARAISGALRIGRRSADRSLFATISFRGRPEGWTTGFQCFGGLAERSIALCDFFCPA
jgi:hypothetical protein